MKNRKINFLYDKQCDLGVRQERALRAIREASDLGVGMTSCERHRLHCIQSLAWRGLVELREGRWFITNRGRDECNYLIPEEELKTPRHP